MAEKHDKNAGETAGKNHVILQKSLNQLLAEHPDWSAGGLFVFFTVIFFFDAIFTGKLFPGQQNALALQSVLGSAFVNEGIYPQWTPFILTGMPGFASLIYTPLSYFFNYPFLLISLFFKTPLLLHIAHYPIAGFGIYLFLRERQVDFTAAMLGGIAFMFAPHIVALETAGHSLQLMAVAWIPMVFWSFSRLLRQGGLINFALAALILGLQFQTGHAQILYYTGILLFIYLIFFIYALLRKKDYKRSGWLVLYFCGILLLAFCLAAMKLLPLYEYLPHSVRGSASILELINPESAFNRATHVSLSFLEMAPFILPSFLGFAEKPLYWGTMPTPGHPLYFGIPILILTGIALIYRRKELIVIFLGSNLILASLLALGNNFRIFNEFIFQYLPFSSAFRHPLAAFALVTLCMALLAGFGLQYLIDFFKSAKKSNKNFNPVIRKIFIAIGVLLLLSILFAVLKTSLFKLMQIIYPDLHAASRQLHIDRMRFAMFVIDWWFLILWLCCSLLLAIMALRKIIGRTAFALGIMLISLADLWNVDFKLNIPAAHLNVNNNSKAADIAAFLKSDSTLFRVLPAGRLFGELGNIAPGVQSLGGTHPARLRLSDDFLHFSKLKTSFVEKYYRRIEEKTGVTFEPFAPETIDAEKRIFQRNLLNFLNVKYVLSTLPIPEPDFILRRQGQYLIDDQQFPLLLYENLQVLPRAYFVDSFQLADSARHVLQLLKSTDLSLHNTVVLQKAISGKPKADSTARCTILSYQCNQIVIETQSAKDQILVISDSFYAPGWHARIDGKPSEILPANFAFRAINVPAGKHKIELYYQSRAFINGIGLTVLGALIITGCFIYSLRKKRIPGRAALSPEPSANES